MSDEYMIAADLTLYSNPLNKALDLKAKPKVTKDKEVTTPKPKQNQDGDQISGEENADETGNETETENENEAMIAADMTKYDSPLADLDVRHSDKEKEGN